MITSKKEYKQYIKADQKARGIDDSLKEKLKQFIYTDPTWRFQKKLRKVEYYQNCKKGFINKIIYFILLYQFKKYSIKLGFSIPPNAFGPGLAIPHYGTIVINSRAKIGANCRIHVCVNIGAAGGNPEAPQIGDNVYIGPGTKIYGNIKIGNNIAIGANSTVNKSIEEEHIFIAGSPAKKIKEFDVKNIIKHI